MLASNNSVGSLFPILFASPRRVFFGRCSPIPAFVFFNFRNFDRCVFGHFISSQPMELVLSAYTYLYLTCVNSILMLSACLIE